MILPPLIHFLTLEHFRFDIIIANMTGFCPVRYQKSQMTSLQVSCRDKNDGQILLDDMRWQFGKKGNEKYHSFCYNLFRNYGLSMKK